MIADDGSSWGVTDTESWVVVASDIIVNKRITVNGTVNLILCDGVSLTAKKGISVLKYPTIGAQRAYFQMNGLTASPNPSEGGGTGVRAFVLNFGDDTQGINAQPIFNLQCSM